MTVAGSQRGLRAGASVGSEQMFVKMNGVWDQ